LQLEASASAVSVILHWVLALVLVFAGLSKLRTAGWTQFRSSVQRLTRLPARWADLAAVAVLCTEPIVAILLISRYPAASVGPIAFIGLMTSFTVVVIFAIARGESASCACFGRHGTTPVGPAIIVRNLFLVGIAGLALLTG